jgi:hypothetical protein
MGAKAGSIGDILLATYTNGHNANFSTPIYGKKKALSQRLICLLKNEQGPHPCVNTGNGKTT